MKLTSERPLANPETAARKLVELAAGIEPTMPGRIYIELINVVAGHIKWSGYRTGPKPTIRIEHHKTGEIVDHPLEADGVKFYEEAEEVLSRLSRLGTPMILYEVEPGKAKTFGMSTMQHKVQRIREALNLAKHFTFDACRQGGM